MGMGYSEWWLAARGIDEGIQGEQERMYASDDGVACSHIVGCHGGSQVVISYLKKLIRSVVSQFYFSVFKYFSFGSCHRVMTISCVN